MFYRSRHLLLFASLSFTAILGFTGINPSPAIAEEPKPIRALLVLGGCCHDYKEQQQILTKGVSARANVQWAVSYDADTGTKHLNPWYEKDDWAKGFDVVVHDECCSDVKDVKTVEKILKPHRDGLPAVILHCGMHSYRTEGYPKSTPWFAFTGVASTGHGPQVPIEIAFVAGDNPITKGLKDWEDRKRGGSTTPRTVSCSKQRSRSPPAVQVLKSEKGTATQATAVCVWTNKYNGKTNVFATTLGHNNLTVADDRYLDLVTRGLLWSVGKLIGGVFEAGEAGAD